MLICTSPDVRGRRIHRTLGLVRGNSIRTRHIGRDIMASFRSLVGGELPEYTKMLAETREEALDRMIEEARSYGADGIVAVRFATSEIMGRAAELLVYGTAVQFEDESP